MSEMHKIDCGITKKDRTRNEYIRGNLKVN